MLICPSRHRWITTINISRMKKSISFWHAIQKGAAPPRKSRQAKFRAVLSCPARSEPALDHGQHGTPQRTLVSDYLTDFGRGVHAFWMRCGSRKVEAAAGEEIARAGFYAFGFRLMVDTQ